MPTTTIPFPLSNGTVATAWVKTGHKRTVRFLSRRKVSAPPGAPSPDYTDQKLIDGARMTAHNFRQLATKASTTRERDSMLAIAAKWERRAEQLVATKHGPQQAPGELFS